MAEEALEWETVDRTVVYTCPGFEVITERVVLPDGTETDFDHVAEPESVGILPLTDDGRVILIEEWRQAVGRVNRGIPAGTVSPDDATVADAAARELREETGYAAERLDAICTVEPANGIADSVNHLFVAHGCHPVGEQHLDRDETIRPAPTQWDELVERVRTGDVRDGRTVTAVSQYLLSSGRIR